MFFIYVFRSNSSIDGVVGVATKANKPTNKQTTNKNRNENTILEQVALLENDFKTCYWKTKYFFCCSLIQVNRTKVRQQGGLTQTFPKQRRVLLTRCHLMKSC